MSRMTLKWMQHVDAISSKVTSRLYFLKQLKRSGAGPEDLLFFYITAICPVLEYACPVWHSNLTVAQTKALESLQQRVMKIIFPKIICCLLSSPALTRSSHNESSCLSSSSEEALGVL